MPVEAAATVRVLPVVIVTSVELDSNGAQHKILPALSWITAYLAVKPSVVAVHTGSVDTSTVTTVEPVRIRLIAAEA